MSTFATESVAARGWRALAWLAVALAAPAAGQPNLGFETVDAGAGLPRGWRLAGPASGVEIASDERVVAVGVRSLRIARTTPGAARLVQRVAAAELRAATGVPGATARVRLTGAVRAESAGATPALWLRIDGPRGPLFLDSFGAGLEHDDAPAQAPVDAEPPAGWRRYALELPLPPDVDEVAFGVSLRGRGVAWFDDLEVTAVATDERPAAAAVAARYLDAALDVMREHALRRDAIDWAALARAAHAHARGAETVADAHLAVRFALRELGDRHSYLQSPAATRALVATAVSNARTALPPAAPVGRRLPEGLGYLAVPGFAGGTPLAQVEFAESVSTIIQQIDTEGVCGWVVDLRQNSGGNLWPMLAGLSPLLGEGELATSVYPDGRRVPVWQRDGQAGFGDYVQLRVRSPYRPAVVAPVAVLLGPATASSAEVLAVAFAGRPATRSFGAPTRGLSAGNRTFELSDGAALVLTVAATGDRAGRVRFGPLAPDEAVAGGGGPSGGGEDEVLRAGVAWLSGRDACR